MCRAPPSASLELSLFFFFGSGSQVVKRALISVVGSWALTMDENSWALRVDGDW